MGETELASTKARLLRTGLWVTGLSVILSLLATHVSFVIEGQVTYWSAMLSSLIIPMVVVPPVYAYCAWLSWRLKGANDRLAFLAHQDPLTRLKNRRAFVEEATRLMQENRRHVLVMIDIDHFKRINDRLGHAGGDSALKHAAETLRRSAPEGALLARIGGEEFGLLVPLPEDDGPLSFRAVQVHVEAMRQQLRALPLITPQGIIHVTASFGLALSRPGEPLDALLGRADKAMYAAKDAGRNRLHAVQ
jgi:diguanylate cyclase (GGDEF)-like protein